MTHLHVWDVTHSYVWHMTWLIHMCDMTHSYVRGGSFICETWLIHMCDITHFDATLSFQSLLIHLWHIHVCETWLVRMCDIWQDSFVRVTWRIRMCDMTHSYVRNDSFICATWRILMLPWAFNLSSFIYDTFTCEDMTCSYVWNITWLIRTYDMTHSYVWHDSFICATWLVYSHLELSFLSTHAWHFHMCETWLIHTCDMTHSCVGHDSFMCVTWLIHMCDMTHSYVWHDSFICAKWLIHGCDMTQVRHLQVALSFQPTLSLYSRHASCRTYEWVMSHVRMSHVARTNESCHMSHIRTSHVSHTFSLLAHDTCTCVRHDSSMCVTCTYYLELSSPPHLLVSHSNVSDKTHSYVWHMTRLIHMCDMPHSHVSLSFQALFTCSCHIHIHIHIVLRKCACDCPLHLLSHIMSQKCECDCPLHLLQNVNVTGCITFTYTLCLVSLSHTYYVSTFIFWKHNVYVKVILQNVNVTRVTFIFWKHNVYVKVKRASDSPIQFFET